MATGEIILSNNPGAVSPEEQALVMAVGIVMDRINRLSKADRDDLFELVTELRQVRGREDVNAICTAMLEILEQKPLRLVPADLDSALPADAKLDAWLKWVSTRLRALRGKAGLTQQQLAERTGLPQSHISRLENGQHSPSRVTLEKLARALRVPLHELDPSADAG